MRVWGRADNRVMQEFGNVLVDLGLLRAFFCWSSVVEDVESGCACGFCCYTRTIYSVSMLTNDGVWVENEIDEK